MAKTKKTKTIFCLKRKLPYVTRRKERVSSMLSVGYWVRAGSPMMDRPGPSY
jgi:hypothetical protein